MNPEILNTISSFSVNKIADDRKEILWPFINYVQDKINNNETIRLNFICTHNSRRSHLSQIWAQTMAYHFGIKNIFCYSGGTEATAMFPKVLETLKNQGFHIQKLSENNNPVYMVKYAQNEAPIICFSKEYNHEFNPKNKFIAILTCDSADQGCPTVFGAEARFPIKYNDPKVYDNTVQMDIKYMERSLEIGQELWWVFQSIK
ncbi:MAG: protein-tyrosine-phosphatase [Saprospiraceae bacterium]